MKNIHVLPTDKSSRLHYSKVKYSEGISYKLNLNQEPSKCNDGLLSGQRNIYITSDEDIKEGDYNVPSDFSKISDISKTSKEDLLVVNDMTNRYKKIILTTDQDLIKDGVQAIDNEFLEWFVKNPSFEEVEVKKGFADGSAYGYDFLSYKIIIPQEEPKQESHICKYCNAETTQPDDECYAKPKQETLEEAAEKYAEENAKDGNISYHNLYAPLEYAFRNGAKWMAEQMYSEKEVIEIVEKSRATGLTAEYLILTEQFKKK
jgi:hypothetical protein